MEDVLETWERKPVVEALKAFRGFKTVAAMTWVSELGDLSRFSHPRSLMSYLGLVPGEDSSGERRRQGAITKCGNGHARWMLIDCLAAPAVPARAEPTQQSLTQEGNAPPTTGYLPKYPPPYPKGRKASIKKYARSLGEHKIGSTADSKHSPCAGSTATK